MIPIGKGLFAEVIESPDDGGIYVELSDRQGKDVHRTDVFPTTDDAMDAAGAFLADYEPARVTA